jgi:hypothetical protein
VRFFVAALLTITACSPPHRSFGIVPALPSCLDGAIVNSVRLTALGDFPPAPVLTASVSAMTSATLALPRETRVVAIDGFGPRGLAAFGRTAPLSLSDLSGGKIAIAYGPPDGLCATATPLVPRAGHRATLLASGAVLITGGWDGVGPATNVELYLPDGDALTAPGQFRLADAALDPGAVMLQAVAPLPDGGALISGGAPTGDDGVPTGVASQGATRHGPDGSSRGDPLLLPGGARAGHSATVLPDGRVLLAGGCGDFDAGVCRSGRVLATTVIFDPTNNERTLGPPLLHARWGHEALPRGDGTVLLVGGRGESGTPPAEIVDPDEARGFEAGMVASATAALITGTVLLVGGVQAPATDAALWLGPVEPPLPLPPLLDPRLAPSVTPLDDGGALVAGGGDGPLYVYDGRGTLSPLAASFAARGHSATRLRDGTVLLLDGLDDSGAPTARARIYFRSPLSAFTNLPPLTLDTGADPLLPRRPDRVQAIASQLRVSAPIPSGDGRPAEWALLAGETVAEFDFDLAVGRRGDAGAALLLAWQSEARYAYVVVEPAHAVELWTMTVPATGQTRPLLVPGCRGQILADDELPDGALAQMHLSWRGGRLLLRAARPLLDCRPSPALGRGSVGVGALHGVATFAALAVSR